MFLKDLFGFKKEIVYMQFDIAQNIVSARLVTRETVASQVSSKKAWNVLEDMAISHAQQFDGEKTVKMTQRF